MIVINEYDHPENFTSQQWLHFSTSDGKEVLSLAGVALLSLGTNTGSWKRDKVKIYLKYPDALKASRGSQYRALHIEHWTVSIVPTAFSSKPSWAGIAVDAFSAAFESSELYWLVPIAADIATMGDVQFNRLAYSVTIVGAFTWLDSPN